MEPPSSPASPASPTCPAQLLDLPPELLEAVLHFAVSLHARRDPAPAPSTPPPSSESTPPPSTPATLFAAGRTLVSASRSCRTLRAVVLASNLFFHAHRADFLGRALPLHAPAHSQAHAHAHPYPSVGAAAWAGWPLGLDFFDPALSQLRARDGRALYEREATAAREHLGLLRQFDGACSASPPDVAAARAALTALQAQAQHSSVCVPVRSPFVEAICRSTTLLHALLAPAAGPGSPRDTLLLHGMLVLESAFRGPAWDCTGAPRLAPGEGADVASRVTARLDEMAEDCRLRAPPAEAPLRKHLEAVLAVLSPHLGPAGPHCYYQVRQSMLSSVLETGEGIPLSLNVCLVHVLRQLGHRAALVNSPGHVLVRVEADGPARAPGGAGSGGGTTAGDTASSRATDAAAAAGPGPKPPLFCDLYTNTVYSLGHAQSFFAAFLGPLAPVRELPPADDTKLLIRAFRNCFNACLTAQAVAQSPGDHRPAAVALLCVTELQACARKLGLLLEDESHFPALHIMAICATVAIRGVHPIFSP